MIRKVALRRFKRFEDVSIDLHGNVVLAGPNNMGKTTVLQAIAAWSLALMRRKKLGDFQRHGGGYPKAPIARQEFAAVPLRNFSLLWKDVAYAGSVEVELVLASGSVTMEFVADSTEQIFVRPKSDAPPERLKQPDLDVVFVPPMTGLLVEEPVYQAAFVAHTLGRARPGEVLRNLLVKARDTSVWEPLADSVRRLFGYHLDPPDSAGAFIVAGYRERQDGPRLDITSAGSGFQQVLMLLTFLYTHPASLLLVDEPDAHLHVIWQDIIFQELQTLAFKQRAQIVLATHSKTIIDSVPPDQLCVLLDPPRRPRGPQERDLLSDALGIVPQTDLMIAESAPGVLYTEDHTDPTILRAWADVLAFMGGDELIEAYLKTKKASTEVLPMILEAAGLPAFPKGEMHEIAAIMQPDEIHPEVVEKLDAIQKAFGL